MEKFRKTAILTLINLSGVIIVAIIIEPLFQLIKTDSVSHFPENLIKIFTIRRIIIWTIISFAFAAYKINRDSKNEER